MALNKQAKEEFQKTGTYTDLLENRPAMMELFASKGYEIWMDWAETMIEGHEKACVYGATLAEREEARALVLAFRKLKDIPGVLGEILGDAAPASVDSPPTTGEAQ